MTHPSSMPSPWKMFAVWPPKCAFIDIKSSLKASASMSAPMTRVMVSTVMAPCRSEEGGGGRKEWV